MKHEAQRHKSGCIDSSDEGEIVVIDDEQWIIGRVGTEFVEVYRRGGAQEVVPIDDVEFPVEEESVADGGRDVPPCKCGAVLIETAELDITVERNPHSRGSLHREVPTATCGECGANIGGMLGTDVVVAVFEARGEPLPGQEDAADHEIVTDGGRDVEETIDDENDETVNDGSDEGSEDEEDLARKAMYDDDDFLKALPECPACGREDFESERGVKIHFGQMHQNQDWSDFVDAGEEDGEADDGDETVNSQQTILELEDDDSEEEVEKRSEQRENAMRTAAGWWDEARDDYETAGRSGSLMSRRDARSTAIKALEVETEWMSVRERSDEDTHDLWRWDENDGWQDDAAGWVQEKLNDELGTDADSNEAKKVAYHAAVGNKVSEDDLDGADSEHTLIAFENGVLQLETVDLNDDGTIDVSSAELIEEKPEHRMTHRLPMTWDPDAADIDLVEGWINDMTGDDQTESRTLWEAGGHSLLPRYNPQGFIIVIADGSNGKTTLFNTFIEALGEKNTTAIPLDKITDSQFSAYRMVDRLANMHADISGATLDDVSALKAATGDDRMEVERKGIDPWDARNRATQLMAANSPPAITESNTAVKRRLLPVILDVEFVTGADPDDPHEMEKDPEIEDKLTSDAGLSAIALKFVEAARRLQEQGEFSMALEYEQDERLSMYQSSADPVADFARVCLERDPNGNGIAIDDIKACYDAYSQDADHPEKTRNTLIRTLKKQATTVMRRSDPSSWTPDDSRIGVYKGMKFTEKAKENWLPEDAHWHKYGGRPDTDDGDDAVNGDGVTHTELDDVLALDPGRYEDVGVKVKCAHELDARPWLHFEAVLKDESNTMRVQSLDEHVLEEGETYVITDFTVVPTDADKQIQLVPAQTDVTKIDTQPTAIDDHDGDGDDTVNGNSDSDSPDAENPSPSESTQAAQDAARADGGSSVDDESGADAAQRDAVYEELARQAGDDGEVELQDVVPAAAGYLSSTTDVVEERIVELKHQGRVYEPETGVLRVIGGEE